MTARDTVRGAVRRLRRLGLTRDYTFTRSTRRTGVVLVGRRRP